MPSPSSFTPKHTWLIAVIIFSMVIFIVFLAGSATKFLPGSLLSIGEPIAGRGEDISKSWSPLVAHSRTQAGNTYYCYDNGAPTDSCESTSHQKQGVTSYLLQDNSSLSVATNAIYSCIGKGIAYYRVTANQTANCSSSQVRLLGYALVDSKDVPDTPQVKLTACHSATSSRIITSGSCSSGETKEDLGFAPPAGKQISAICEALEIACAANPDAPPCDCGAKPNQCTASGIAQANFEQDPTGATALSNQNNIIVTQSQKAEQDHPSLITGKISVKLTPQQYQALREISATSYRAEEDKVIFPPLDTPEEIARATQAVPDLKEIAEEITIISFSSQNPHTENNQKTDRWITITTNIQQHAVPLEKIEPSATPTSSLSILNFLKLNAASTLLNKDAPASITAQAQSALTKTTTLHNKANSLSFEKTNPIFQVQAHLVPPDHYYNSSGSWGQLFDDLWGIKKINPESTWDSEQGEGALVAVVDSGVDRCHPDLSENIWNNPGETGKDSQGRDKRSNNIDDDSNGYVDDWRGWDFTNDDNDPFDDLGHGTHVAGTIAAPINGSGIVGVAPKTRIIAIKALDQNGISSNDILGEAVKYAADLGADVINASWGYAPYGGKDAYFEEAFEYSTARNVVNIASAGNSNADLANFTPANLPTTIAVSALDSNDYRSSFSNYGSLVSVSAPGQDILSTIPNVRFSVKQGTSMAAPHVSGLAALIISKNPTLSPSQVQSIIQNNTDDIGSAGKDNDTGYGRINVGKALSSF